MNKTPISRSSDSTFDLETVQDFVDQVVHQTMSAAYIENKHFFTKSCHRQTYQNYEQPPQRSLSLSFQKSMESF